jgi:CHASE3 domain sensor protein
MPLIAAFFLALALVGLGWAAALYVNRLNWVTHTRQVEGAIGDVYSAIQDYELAVRGYALNGTDAQTA